MKERAQEKPVFHYDRAKRLSARGAPAPREKKTGIFRNNPSLKIILLDLLLVLLLALGMRLWLSYEKDSGKFAGYWVRLETVAVKDKLFVSLELEKTLQAEPLQENVEALFRLSSSGTEVIHEISFTRGNAERQELELSLPLQQTDKRLQVRLRLGKMKETFLKKIH